LPRFAIAMWPKCERHTGNRGNFVGGFVAAFLFAEIISLGGLFSDLEWGYVLAFAFFILMMFIRPAGLLARRQ